MSDIPAGYPNCGGHAEAKRSTTRRGLAEPYIHGRDGMFRDRDSIGGDTFPREG